MNEHKPSHEAAPAPDPATTSSVQIDLNKLFLPGAILIAAIMISGTLLYTKSQTGTVAAEQPKPAAKVQVSKDDDAVLGNEKAKVTIIEFSDYECPYCQRFWQDTFSQLKKDYIDTGKVNFVYRDYPLSFHPGAQPAAEAAECAGDQNKYWEMHDAIFGGQATEQISVANLKKWAQGINLDMTDFNSCFDSGKHREEVKKDTADGVTAGVSGTPTFFINGTRVVGAVPYANIQQLIEEEL